MPAVHAALIVSQLFSLLSEAAVASGRLMQVLDASFTQSCLLFGCFEITPRRHKRLSKNDIGGSVLLLYALHLVTDHSVATGAGLVHWQACPLASL